eukprot:1158533-Pelagomonas_calceolata.AAC.2
MMHACRPNSHQAQELLQAINATRRRFDKRSSQAAAELKSKQMLPAVSDAGQVSKESKGIKCYVWTMGSKLWDKMLIPSRPEAHRTLQWYDSFTYAATSGDNAVCGLQACVGGAQAHGWRCPGCVLLHLAANWSSGGPSKSRSVMQGNTFALVSYFSIFPLPPAAI